MMFALNIIFLYETGPIQWIYTSEHCGCWWPDLWINTRVSVATVLSTHPCVSSCLWVKPNTMQRHLFFISFEMLLESLSLAASIWNLMQLKGRFHLNFTFSMFNWQLLFETMSLCLLRLYSVWLVAWGISLFKKKNFKYIPRLLLGLHPANERR